MPFSKIIKLMMLLNQIYFVHSLKNAKIWVMHCLVEFINGECYTVSSIKIQSTTKKKRLSPHSYSQVTLF